MRGRPPHWSILAVAVGVTLGAVAPVLALQPCRPRRPASLIYPTETANVARNAVIVVWAASRTRLRLLGPAGGVIAVSQRGAKTSTESSSGVVQLVPRQPLTANALYEVQLSRQQRDLSKPGMPFVWRPYARLARFRTGHHLAGRNRPMLRRATLAWSKVIARDYLRRRRARIWVSGGGRQGTLRLEAGATNPAWVEVQIWLRSPGNPKPMPQNFGFAFRRTLEIARVGPCGSSLRLSNVRGGRYRLVVTPWSAGGIAGPSLTIGGRIR
ncbi:MAG: hypothetical protein KC609_07415 [Myxococcales bacterium]|nr:hypothetical protein [Myxococcales bacterium]